MTPQERKLDAHRHETFTNLLHDTLHAARPTSRAQIAAGLTRGLDDPTPISKPILDKICEGAPNAKLPIHKLPRLLEITNNPAILHWLAQETRHLLIPQPQDHTTDLHDLIHLMKKQTQAADTILDAQCAHSEGGTHTTKNEAQRIAKTLDDLAAYAITLKLNILHKAI